MHTHTVRLASLALLTSSALLASSELARAQNNGRQILSVWGGPTTSAYGSALASIGDVNGDGQMDFLVGAEGAAGGGLAVVHSGADGAVLRTLRPMAGDANFGYSVAGAGDLDGDGTPDLLVGARTVAYAFSGASGALLTSVRGLGSLTVAGPGDVDGDGVPDLAIGELDRGWVVSGATGQFLWESLYSGHNTIVGSAGDVNGDSTPDVWMRRRRSVAVYAGGTGQLIWSHTNQYRIAAAGDVDGDGFDDILATDTFTEVISGRTRLRIRRYPIAGTALAGGVDVNGDGTPDLAIGVWSDSTVATFAGRVVVLSGRDSAQLAEYFGRESGDQLGSAIALHEGLGTSRRGAVLANAFAQFNGFGSAGAVLGIAELQAGESEGSFGILAQRCSTAPTRLRALPGTPAIGKTLALALDTYRRPLPPATVLVLGVSSQSWSGVQLPLSLEPFGLPCSLHVSAEVPIAGTATVWLLAVPNQSALVGATLYAQALTGGPIDHATNSAVVTIGN